MTEDGKSLNLIQRALDRKLNRETSAPMPVEAVPLTSAPLEQSVVAAPRPAKPLPAAAAFQQVRMNMAVLRKSGMIIPDVKTSTVANEFRNIKRKVLTSARDKKSRELLNNLIMITSTLPAEGKTFTSMNLALSMAAERDLQVLLVDADLHRPSVGRFFEIAKVAGLSDMLTDSRLSPEDVTYQCDTVSNLHVIFAGNRVDDSPELIASTRMRDLLVTISEQARNRIVIIDTPPALTSFEPAILAPHVHQTVMVVSAQHAGRQQIEKALEAISACNNINLLFNRAPKWEQRDGGYYYNYEPRPDQA